MQSEKVIIKLSEILPILIMHQKKFTSVKDTWEDKADRLTLVVDTVTYMNTLYTYREYRTLLKLNNDFYHSTDFSYVYTQSQRLFSRVQLYHLYRSYYFNSTLTYATKIHLRSITDITKLQRIHTPNMRIDFELKRNSDSIQKLLDKSHRNSSMKLEHVAFTDRIIDKLLNELSFILNRNVDIQFRQLIHRLVDDDTNEELRDYLGDIISKYTI